MIVLLNVDGLGDFVDSPHCDVTSLLESVRNLQGVDTLLKQLHGLLKKSPCEDHHSGSPVANLVVLGLREVDKEASGLVFNLHLLEDGSSIVGDDNLPVWATN